MFKIKVETMFFNFIFYCKIWCYKKMKKWTVSLFFLASLGLFSPTAKTAAENVCGDWTTYKEEKCVKVLNISEMQSFENAVKTCAAIDGSKLLTINHSEEQAFIADLLFTKLHLANSVWLGAKISSQQSFHWENGKKVTFTNWAPENPKNHSTESCVQIHSEEELQGQWSNEPCTKLNRIVCEKGQTWSLQTMQEIILKMIENPIPIGFIYVQLPQEKAPQEIWPSLVFTDISSAYDSAFFRVVGNKGAAAFGTEQQQQSPAIDEIKYEDCQQNPTNLCATNKFNSTGDDKLKPGWSQNIVSANGFNTAGAPSRFLATLKFHTTTGEVRPRNFAIKVWKRTS